MPFCTQCGAKNPDDAKFCSQCGSPLRPPSGAAGSSATPPSRPEPPASLVDSSATITFGVSNPEADDREGLGDEAAAAVDALPQGSALLVVQRGPGAGSRFLLDQDVVTAGRHPQSEIFLDDITVSRHHVEFRRTPDGFTVADVGSLNGTYVNRDRIEQSALTNGDEVQVGKFRLVYFSGGDAPGRV